MNKNKKEEEKATNHQYNTSEIEQIIDEIIVKNKEKLDKIYEKEIDTIKLAFRDRRDNTIFYLRKKTDKKPVNIKEIHKEIIAEAKNKLGETASKSKTEKDKTAETEVKKEKKKRKIDSKIDLPSIQETLERRSSSVENYDTVTKSVDELLESDELYEVVSDFEKELKIDEPRELEDEAKIIDEKLKKTPVVEETKEKEDVAEKKSKELAEKHGFFKEKKTTEDSLLKKEENNVTESDVDETKKIDEKEKKFLDEKILSVSSEKKLKDKKKKEWKKEKTKERKFFFKREKLEVKTGEVLGSKKRKKSRVFKPRFHVENLPTKDTKFLDENIKKKQEIKEDDSFDEKITAELKAFRKLEETIKAEKNVEETKTPFVAAGNSEKTVTLDTGLLDETQGREEEHVFFDEDDSFEGWSPHLTEKEEDKKPLPISGKPEIASDEYIPGGDIELPREVLSVKSVKLSDLGFSENDWEELDFYPLHEPFAYVEILRERETLDKCYFLVEVEIDDEERRILDFITETMKTVAIDTEELELRGDEEYLIARVDEIIREYNIEISEESKEKILYYLGKTSIGLGKIDPLMKDPNIEDISCDGAGVPIFLYHRKYGSLRSNIRFNDEDELSSFVYKLAQKCGKHISIAEPMLDATMPDGSRVQMTLSDEVTARGSTFTIRKFRDDPFSPPDLVEFNTMSSEMLAYFWLAIENGINVLFAGGTASGKTTALNAISLFIPRESKIVSIEETREINLPHPNWIPGVARTGFGEVVADKVVGEIDMYDLMKAALRQRPEYILVGEIRGREAYVLFQAMATGHATYSTVHADSAQSLIHRLEGKPINIPRVMLQSLDVISLHVITRVKNTRARRCKQVIEIIDIDPTTKEILTNEVFRWDPVEDKFIYTGKSYVLERIRAEKDLTREEMTNELKNRMEIIEWMNRNNIREFREVANIVAHYAEDPEEVLEQVHKDVKK